jgi:cytoskeletal protein CcmA (bactofilin family)
VSFLKKRIDVKTIPTEALSVLDEREKLIFTGRVQGSTLKSLAIDIGLSATRVGQLEKRVFLKVGAELFRLGIPNKFPPIIGKANKTYVKVCGMDFLSIQGLRPSAHNYRVQRERYFGDHK